MPVKNFRRGETTYTCGCCGKLTRNTGDEGQAGLCLDCYTLAGIENVQSDSGDEEMVRGCGDEARSILARRPELAERFKSVAWALQAFEGEAAAQAELDR